MVKILKILADNGRNLEYMYGFTGKVSNRAYMIIRCSDIPATEKVFEENKITMVSEDQIKDL